MNKVILIGNLTRDIEMKYTQGGKAIGSTGIAVTRKYKSATGEQKEDVMFVDLTFFGRSAEVANQYTRKGSKVAIDGSLKLDQWTAQDGSKRSRHTVTVNSMEMLTPKQSEGATPYNNIDDPNRHNVGGSMNRPAHHQEPGGPGAYAPQDDQNYQPAPVPEIDINEDDIPFN